MKKVLSLVPRLLQAAVLAAAMFVAVYYFNVDQLLLEWAYAKKKKIRERRAERHSPV